MISCLQKSSSSTFEQIMSTVLKEYLMTISDEFEVVDAACVLCDSW